MCCEAAYVESMNKVIPWGNLFWTTTCVSLESTTSSIAYCRLSCQTLLAARLISHKYMDAYVALSCCLWLLLFRDSHLQTSETLIRWLAFSCHEALSSSHNAVNLLRFEMISWFFFATLVCAKYLLWPYYEHVQAVPFLWIELPTHNLSAFSLWGASFWCSDTTSALNLSSPLRFSHCAGRIRLGSFACCQTLATLMLAALTPVMLTKSFQPIKCVSTSDAASFVPISFQCAYICS